MPTKLQDLFSQKRIEKILHYIEQVSLVIAVIVPVLTVLHIIFLWPGISQNFFPLPVYLQITKILSLLIVVGFCAFFFAMYVLLSFTIVRRQITSRKMLLLLLGTMAAIPMCCIVGVKTLRLPNSIHASAKLDQNQYYINYYHDMGDIFTNYHFAKCNENGSECEEIYRYWEGPIFGASALMVDQDKHEIHFFHGSGYTADSLIYTYGPDPREYKFEDISFGASTFILYSYEKNSIQEFLITKCNEEIQTGIPCEILPFRYSTETFEKEEFVNDESTGEIKLFVDDRLIFTYDTAPHCLAEGCIIIDK